MREGKHEMTYGELQEVFGSIPCGVCVLRIEGECFFPIFHNRAFYEVLGWEEKSRTSAELEANYLGVHPEDFKEFKEKAKDVIHREARLRHTCRLWNERQKKYRWILIEGSLKRKNDGDKYLYSVFTDVSDQQKMEKGLLAEREHLLNSIPGGVASYRVEEGEFIPVYFSDGMLDLSGHSGDELRQITMADPFRIIHESDKERVRESFLTALNQNQILDVSYRIRHKNGDLAWVHLNGRFLDSADGGRHFFAVFTGTSPETRLFQNIADEVANGIYVIDKKNYDLLYISENVKLFPGEGASIGQKCYAALHGKDVPCEFCTLSEHEPDGEDHEMIVPGTGKFYNTRFREVDWNGIPAYVKYVQDTTEDVLNRREKHRLEEYFYTIVKNLPGGIAVIRYEADGMMAPEYMSEGFARMIGMSEADAWRMYNEDITAGIHPDDRDRVRRGMSEFIKNRESHYKDSYRMKKEDGSYIWVRSILSSIQSEGGIQRVYVSYQDITADREEQERLLRQYNEKIIEHYHMRGADTLIAGNCNITQDRIVEMEDHTNSGLLEMFGSRRDGFFSGVASLIVDEDEQQAFRNTYLNKPALEAFQRGETEVTLSAFVKMPKETRGRYLQFTVNMVEAPDTNDITGILTVIDITEETISSRILQHLSIVSYDLVEDVNLGTDRYKILKGHNGGDIPELEGCYSERNTRMINEKVLPKDRVRVTRMLDTSYMLKRLEKEKAYSFPYSIMNDKGEVLAKNMTVSASDLRLGRVCLARTDVTESVQEQRRLLNVIAYTFEVLAFIDIAADRLIMYTRQTVLENLPPYTVDHYSKSLRGISKSYDSGSETESAEYQFRVETMLERLEESPSGYDFVLPYHSDGSLRYKQVNVLWGDKNRTVCMVRADVTDILAAERKAKDAIEKALALAEEANLAKSDFLSSMSHDIRTPMNAITGMTTLAMAHLDEKEKVEEYLKKIVLSSKHLLSLINDILDMNKIERSKITLGRGWISMSELADQLSDMIDLQAKESGVKFQLHLREVSHDCFYGDALRINQILINILSNAVKFTPEGGSVDFIIEEIRAKEETSHVRYLFRISDTGIGMSEEFLSHVFEPFTRGRNVTKVEGSGLGLSIVKGLVELMGGEIAVSSRVHQGTTFRIELEFEAAQKSDGDTLAGQETASPITYDDLLEGRSFLLAEDNAINAEILCELLGMHGIHAVVKTDGIQTVQEFKRAEPGTYDAILMDIQMPFMNGFDAAREIRKLDREDAKSIPIIAMTANAFEEDIQEAIAAGMDAHVAKPIDVQQLWSTLGRELSRKS